MGDCWTLSRNYPIEFVERWEECKIILGPKLYRRYWYDTSLTNQHLFRAYVLYFIITCLMPNDSGNLVNLKWLSLLDKSPQGVGQYSWGSTCLAMVYRSLCGAAVYGVNKMEGCIILLQAWAYSIMSCIAPVPTHPT